MDDQSFVNTKRINELTEIIGLLEERLELTQADSELRMQRLEERLSTIESALARKRELERLGDILERTLDSAEHPRGETRV